MDLKRGIDLAVDAVVAELKAIAQPCTTSQEMAHVAAISANNDRSIGELIARAMDKVGREGAVSIEDGSGLASELEVVEGLQFDRGYLSPYFINNAERQAAVLENAAIVLCDQKLSAINDLVPLLEAAAKDGAPLLVVAEDVDADALATLVVNSVRGVIKACAVRAPGFGDRRKALLQDMAVLTGGTVISSDLGLTLAKAKLEHLGRARRIEVDKDSTTIIGGAGDAQAIRDRVAAIRKEREAQASEYERKQLDERIA
jgi:chaperonin GroEL